MDRITKKKIEKSVRGVNEAIAKKQFERMKNEQRGQIINLLFT